jgi:carboxyl-terminal processing protease
MRNAKYVGLLAVLFLAGLCARAVRADEEVKSQPYVVLVGIDKYADPQILPRQHAQADAKALYDVVTNKEHLGVDAAHVRLLLGQPDEKRKSEPATRENILKALNWVAANAKPDDLVLFAFIGQGAPLGERSCYFATDSTFKNRAKDAVASGDIENALEKLQSQRFCAFVDVHVNGFDSGKEKRPDPNLVSFYREFLGKDDEKLPAASRVVFLSNNGLKPSLDLKSHGIFAKVLLDGLRGKADREGYEPDGLITVEELAKYVRKELPDLARANGKTDEEKAQTPVVIEAQTRDFVIDRNPAITALTEKRLAAFKKIAKDNELAKDLVEEAQNLLARMPKLEAQQQLRKAYQKLADGTLALDAFRKERADIVATTRLTEDEALTYARTVLRAVEVVREGYFKPVNQGQLVEYAIRGLFKNLNENVPSMVKERLDNVKNLEKGDLLKLLAEARQHLGKREDLASGKDITQSLHPMLNKLDRHTDYTDPETIARENIGLQGQFSGIGVQIRKNNTKDMLQVVTPIIGSPAYKAKMYAGDIITTIVREVDSTGKPLATPEVIPTKGMTTEEAVKKILGKEGTKIKLLVEREGADKPIEFNLIRGRVVVESAVGAKRNADDSWDYVIDPDNKICYVRLIQFNENARRDLAKTMEKLSKAGIKGFILDLRFNPGGTLDSAVKIADMFIDDGMIVSIKPRNGAETSYIGKSDGSYTAFPMVCLVNGYSASASEIVAACLQDHNRAIVLGSRSYGKGSVQTLLPFETGGRLKLTTATFWRPSGLNLNKSSTQGRDEDEWGVTPTKGHGLNLPVKDLNDLQDHQRDQEIIHRPDRPRETKNGFRDRQLDMALDYLRGQIKMAGKVNGAKKAG